MENENTWKMEADTSLSEHHQEAVGQEENQLLANYTALLSMNSKAKGESLRDAINSLNGGIVDFMTENGGTLLGLCTINPKFDEISKAKEELPKLIAKVEVLYRTDSDFSKQQYLQAADHAWKEWLKNIAGSNYVTTAKDQS